MLTTKSSINLIFLKIWLFFVALYLSNLLLIDVAPAIINNQFFCRQLKVKRAEHLCKKLYWCNEEDSPTLNLPIWPLDGALYKGRRFGGQQWCQGKTS
jgi:hypothetical protein